MKTRTLRIILTIFFIGLLATPFIIKRLSASKEATTASANPSTALSRYGLSFQEAAHASGIYFTHVAPKLDPKLDHIMPQIASMGAACFSRRFRSRWLAGHLSDKQRRRQE